MTTTMSKNKYADRFRKNLSIVLNNYLSKISFVLYKGGNLSIRPESMYYLYHEEVDSTVPLMDVNKTNPELSGYKVDDLYTLFKKVGGVHLKHKNYYKNTEHLLESLEFIDSESCHEYVMTYMRRYFYKDVYTTLSILVYAYNCVFNTIINGLKELDPDIADIKLYHLIYNNGKERPGSLVTIHDIDSTMQNLMNMYDRSVNYLYPYQNDINMYFESALLILLHFNLIYRFINRPVLAVDDFYDISFIIDEMLSIIYEVTYKDGVRRIFYETLSTNDIMDNMQIIMSDIMKTLLPNTPISKTRSPHVNEIAVHHEFILAVSEITGINKSLLCILPMYKYKYRMDQILSSGTNRKVVSFIKNHYSNISFNQPIRNIITEINYYNQMMCNDKPENDDSNIMYDTDIVIKEVITKPIDALLTCKYY